MKQIYKDFRSTILVALIAFTVCWASNQWIFYPKFHAVDPDEWLEEKLKLTNDQIAQLKDVEVAFEKDRSRLVQEITEADKELAKVLLEEKQYSERVRVAADRVNVLQAQLKSVTLKHFYDMKPVLTPEQVEIMNQLIVHALSHSP